MLFRVAGVPGECEAIDDGLFCAASSPGCLLDKPPLVQVSSSRLPSPPCLLDGLLPPFLLPRRRPLFIPASCDENKRRRVTVQSGVFWLLFLPFGVLRELDGGR